MIPQMTTRRVGKVSIIDMNGSITGLWTTRLKTQLEHTFQGLHGHPTVLNLRHVTDIDSLGLKSLFNATSHCEDLRVLAGTREIMDFFNHYPESKHFQFLRDEQDLVETYGHELLSENVLDSEHRGTVRLQTALSIKFTYGQNLEGKECVGIVSNLSENGFYVEYIDILSVADSLTALNPYDIQFLQFTLLLPNGKTVSGNGKVLHWQLTQDQFGIGVRIEEFNEGDEKRFSEFLKLQKASIPYNQKGR